jgi:hypothetical protein
MVLNGLLRLVGQHRPLLFFGLPGLAMLLAGLGLGAHVVRIYETTRLLAVGYALITVLFSITGTIALFTGMTLHSIRGLIMELAREKQQNA